MNFVPRTTRTKQVEQVLNVPAWPCSDTSEEMRIVLFGIVGVHVAGLVRREGYKIEGSRQAILMVVEGVTSLYVEKRVLSAYMFYGELDVASAGCVSVRGVHLADLRARGVHMADLTLFVFAFVPSTSLSPLGS